MILNQLYRENETKQRCPHIEATFKELWDYGLEKKLTRSGGRPIGRHYDQAILYHQVPDWKDKKVCELGARDGYFGSWLTKECAEVHMSDYFEEWGKNTPYDLGSFSFWRTKWESAAFDKDKLHCSVEDITKLSYPDNYFDIVICTSVLEHLHNQKKWMGDMVGIREIARITKPGGYILLSTDMTSSESQWYSGTFYYNEVDLFDRIIRPSRCELIGDYDFNFDDPNNSDARILKPVGMVASAVFALRKP